MEDVFSRKDDSLFANSYSFLRLPMVKDPTDTAADIVVLGMPTTWQPPAVPGRVLGLMPFAAHRLIWLGKASATPGLSR